MVAPDFNVGRGCASTASAKQNALGRRLKIVVDDLVSSACYITYSSPYRLRLCAASGLSDAVEIRKKGIDHRNITGSWNAEAARRFVMIVAMYPHTVKNDSLCIVGLDEVVDRSRVRLTSDFQADEAVMVRYLHAFTTSHQDS